jgi:hypothetical protein
MTDTPTVEVPARVEQACRHLLDEGAEITFPAVAQRVGVGRTTLYRRPELRALVEDHRQRGREAHTLTGITTQVDQLRATLEALAHKVARHEEQLRALRRSRQ